MDPIDPTTPEGMKVLTLRAVELCRLRLTMSGGFEQRCGLYVGSTTEEFTLSTRAAASSLSRILQEAQKEAHRAHAGRVAEEHRGGTGALHVSRDDVHRSSTAPRPPRLKGR